jgi:hypothetical protein
MEGRFKMKLSSVLALVALSVFLPLALFSQAAMPRMTAVDPGEGKPGDTITVTGENLEKANVAEIYLTDGKNDLKLQVLEQAATTVKVKVPNNCKPGRWALMVLTTGKDPKLIEQPVKFTALE